MQNLIGLPTLLTAAALTISAQSGQPLSHTFFYQDSTASKQTPYEKSMEPFLKALAHSCPAKKLENLPPAELNYQIELFEKKLTPQQDKEYRAEVKAACKDVIAGTGCENVAFLRFAKDRRLTLPFVKILCRSELKCSAPGECSTR